MSTYNAKQIANLKFTAVRSLVGEAGGFLISGDGTVTFDENTTAYTDEQIQTEMDRIQDVWDSENYARTRADAYPTIEDQLDMQYWDAVNGTTTWQDAIQAVKDANPKPE